jgi:hypothetical protein
MQKEHKWPARLWNSLESGIEIASNEKAISGSREAKNVIPILRNFLR